MRSAERQERVQFVQERLHLRPREGRADDDGAQWVAHEADAARFRGVLDVGHDLLDESAIVR